MSNYKYDILEEVASGKEISLRNFVLYCLGNFLEQTGIFTEINPENIISLDKKDLINIYTKKNPELIKLYDTFSRIARQAENKSNCDKMVAKYNKNNAGAKLFPIVRSNILMRESIEALYKVLPSEDEEIQIKLSKFNIDKNNQFTDLYFMQSENPNWSELMQIKSDLQKKESKKEKKLILNEAVQYLKDSGKRSILENQNRKTRLEKMLELLQGWEITMPEDLQLDIDPSREDDRIFLDNECSSQDGNNVEQRVLLAKLVSSFPNQIKNYAGDLLSGARKYYKSDAEMEMEVADDERKIESLKKLNPNEFFETLDANCDKYLKGLGVGIKLVKGNQPTNEREVIAL